MSVEVVGGSLIALAVFIVMVWLLHVLQLRKRRSIAEMGQRFPSRIMEAAIPGTGQRVIVDQLRLPRGRHEEALLDAYVELASRPTLNHQNARRLEAVMAKLVASGVFGVRKADKVS